MRRMNDTGQDTSRTQYFVVDSNSRVLARTAGAEKYTSLLPSNPSYDARPGLRTAWQSQAEVVSLEVRTLARPPRFEESVAGDSELPSYLIVIHVHRNPYQHLQLSEPLTARQQQVFAFLRRGASNKVIAQELGLSPGTIHTHVRDVLKKFGVRSRIELVATDVGFAPS